MRIGTFRGLLFAAVIVTFAAVAGAAPPVADPKGNGETAASEKRAQLHSELMQLLKKINDMPSKSTAPTPTAPKPKPLDTGDGTKVSAIKEGMNLFRDGKYDGARITFQLIDPVTLAPEDRAFVKYMLASSLRRLGKVSDAETMYREVANSPDDEFLASCAIWQLSLIRSEQELQGQLEQLRSRAKSK